MPTLCYWTRGVLCSRPSWAERPSTTVRRTSIHESLRGISACVREETTGASPQQFLWSKRGDAVVTSDMYREINEQPEVLATILEKEWETVAHAARTLRSRGFRFAMLAARGTSDNAALYAKYLFEVLLGIPTALASPSTFTLYEGRMNLDDVLVIGISQSGESKDILETASRTRELGASTLTITNDDGSSLAKAAE